MVAADPRKRRRVLLTILLVGLILVGGLVVKVVLFATAKPTISTDYTAEYNKRVRPAGFDPNDNAAPLYREAFARLPAMPEEIPRIVRLRDHDPTSVEWKIVETWVLSGTEALDLLHRAAAKPCFWGVIPVGNTSDPLIIRDKDFTGFREAAFCLRHMAEYQALRGDAPGAFRCIVTGCRMGRHLTYSGRVYANLGQNLIMLAHIWAFELLSQVDVDPRLLADVQKQLEDTFSAERPLSFAGDEVVLLDIMQRFFTDNGRADGHLVLRDTYDQYRRTRKPHNQLEANVDYLRHLYIAWTHPTRRQTAQTFADLIQTASQCVEQSPWELRRQGTSHEDLLREATKGNWFLRSCALADILMARMIVGHYETHLSTEALITTMGLLRFHADKGTGPQSLEELAAAGYIRQVPIDPYSGKPLVYGPVKDTFTLYSLGRDFDDDRGTRSVWGKPPNGGDQVFWPVEERKK